MKSHDLPKDFPVSPEDWEKLVAEAPGRARPPTPEEAAAWAKDEVFPGGGVEAYVAQRRRRGPGRAPLKVPTTIRFDTDVLDALKATGRGWQTRVNEAMREWVKTHGGSER